MNHLGLVLCVVLGTRRSRTAHPAVDGHLSFPCFTSSSSEKFKATLTQPYVLVFPSITAIGQQVQSRSEQMARPPWRHQLIDDGRRLEAHAPLQRTKRPKLLSAQTGGSSIKEYTYQDRFCTTACTKRQRLFW
ncbi:hypothetical protein BV25DRAFT_123236 [Artomyces pyxidatus]|uniref:Uncharacterized protein n=1 Tax=Artomyces pyxidatus TaxID=48021 RepID=A0ACB8TLH2_9AGAM|nr:hypothetical protein BV25DRAFT_123236 [Artomyces pyxidatus]